jgi:hypothetical protein
LGAAVPVPALFFAAGLSTLPTDVFFRLTGAGAGGFDGGRTGEARKAVGDGMVMVSIMQPLTLKA